MSNSDQDESSAVDGTGEPTPTEGLLAEEMKAIPYEPLLPIEKKLIVGSLLLGALLLGVLWWASHTFFPAANP